MIQPAGSDSNFVFCVHKYDWGEVLLPCSLRFEAELLRLVFREAERTLAPVTTDATPGTMVEADPAAHVAAIDWQAEKIPVVAPP